MANDFASENRDPLNAAHPVVDFDVKTAPGARLLRAASVKRLERKNAARVLQDRLLANGILRALPEEDFARLLPHLEPISLVFGQDLYRAGEAARYVYFPENSVISHLHILSDGSMIEAAMIGREGVVGLFAIFNSDPPSYCLHITIAGSALRLKTEILNQEFGRDSALQRLLLRYASARIQQISQRAACNARHAVEKRLCTWLLMIQDRVGEDQFPLTQELIAHHLGARRAGVTTAANALRDKQIIDYSRGLIRIVDRRGLEAAACECYPAAQLQN